ncbi:uncharacterized protein LOC120846565 isoform X2 [Ixodes scapularis]|uniref:uncharacterized protein LOC120846565 isoform X2 n=1 Tax=Ixodes scapularis TaxID=6945 RepID=UPI001C3850B3|nr:uncharacterized protein LOC120846565 isoform X2 [Ixodes scapularis]
MASKILKPDAVTATLAIGRQSQFDDHREKGKWETSKGSQCRRKTASRRFHLCIQLLLSQRHNPAKCKTATRSLCLRRAPQLHEPCPYSQPPTPARCKAATGSLCPMRMLQLLSNMMARHKCCMTLLVRVQLRHSLHFTLN